MRAKISNPDLEGHVDARTHVPKVAVLINESVRQSGHDFERLWSILRIFDVQGMFGLECEGIYQMDPDRLRECNQPTGNVHDGDVGVVARKSVRDIFAAILNVLFSISQHLPISQLKPSL